MTDAKPPSLKKAAYQRVLAETIAAVVCTGPALDSKLTKVKCLGFLLLMPQ
ncbi:MAG: hypothetical protein JWO51_119 [Rhodospirillales bacterium]|nr:hypothetical protein [Rhodospirillales bacterium]